MVWTKLDNPKPGANPLGGDQVRISARAAMRESRYIRVKIGKDAARKASMQRQTHRVHILVGSAEERGNLAIVCDDTGGAFLAKVKKDGTYELTVSANAAAGRFRTEFPPFTADAKVVPNNSGPGYITFTAINDFFA